MKCFKNEHFAFLRRRQRRRRRWQRCWRSFGILVDFPKILYLFLVLGQHLPNDNRDDVVVVVFLCSLSIAPGFLFSSFRRYFLFFVGSFWYLSSRFTFCFMPLFPLSIISLCVLFFLSYSLLCVHCVFYYDYIKKKFCFGRCRFATHTYTMVMMLASTISANEAKFRIQIINVFLSVGRVVQLNPCAWFTMRNTEFYGASALYRVDISPFFFVFLNCFLAVFRFVCDDDDEADCWHNVVAADDNGGGDGGLQLKCQALLFHETLNFSSLDHALPAIILLFLARFEKFFILVFILMVFFFSSLLLFLQCKSNDSSGFTVRIMINRWIWGKRAFVLLEFPYSVLTWKSICERNQFTQ